jgi:hypothetical protein
MFAVRRGLRLSAAVLTAALAAGAAVALAGPAAAAVPGYQIVSFDSASNSSNKAATATCPGATRVIGTAASVQSGNGEVVIESVIPGATTVTAVAFEDDDGFAGNWIVRATAVCATAPPGLELVFEDNGQSAGPVGAEVAQCPAGKQSLGSGTEVMGGYGEVWTDVTYPTGTQGVSITYEDETGTANLWNLRAWVICSNPLPGYQVVTATSANNAVNKNAAVTCPAGTVVLSAGYALGNGNGQVVGDSRLAGTTVTAFGREDDTGLGTNWEIIAYASCATA